MGLLYLVLRDSQYLSLEVCPVFSERFSKGFSETQRVLLKFGEGMVSSIYEASQG